MAQCINCSAPLPPNTIVCDYCGSRNDTDLMGVHTYTTHELESGRICPRCNIALQTIDLKIDGRFFIERCDQCMGLFFDTGELEVLLDASVKNVFSINFKKLTHITDTMAPETLTVAYIKCPVCNKFMNRSNFGSRSGVIVNACGDHGIWLDSGELRRLFEWKKAGGTLLHEQRQLEAAREKAKKEKEKAAEAQFYLLKDEKDERGFGSLLDKILSRLF